MRRSTRRRGLFVHPDRFARRRDRFNASDVIKEAVLGLSARPGRLVTLTFGVILGVGMLVTTVGLAQASSHQMRVTLQEAAGRYVSVSPRTDPIDSSRVTAVMPWDGHDSVKRLRGVQEAGLVAKVTGANLTVRAAPVYDPLSPPIWQPPVFGATPGLLEAVGGRMIQGAPLTAFHEVRSERVAVLGRKAAAELGVWRIDNAPTIFLGDTSYTVIGIIGDMERRLDLDEAVLVPLSSAKQHLGLSVAGELWATVAPGAGQVLLRQIPAALSASDSSGFAVAVPPGLTPTQAQLTEDVNRFFVVISVGALIVGALIIALLTTMSVVERRGEIGLRLALGATSSQIASQFIAESSIVGLLGGINGAAIGALCVSVICWVRHWHFVQDSRVLLAGVVIGGIVGLLAAPAPATRAARTEPADALQEGT